MNQYGNPYMNPYNTQPQGFQQNYMQIPQRQVDMVNGRNGAMQYPMGPNQKAWILDESGLISWLIQTDSACYRTVTPYDVKPHEDAPTPDYGSLETRITKLEEIINGHTNTDNPAATRKRTNNYRQDDGTD